MPRDTMKWFPRNLDAERAVLGAVLLDNASLQAAFSILNASDFSLDCHRRIFTGMAALSKSRRPIDLITLAEELERAGALEAVGGAAYLASLSDGMARTTNLEHYARIVKEKSRLRELACFSQDILARTMHPGADPESLARELSAHVARLASATVASRRLDLQRLVDVVAEDVSFLWQPYIPKRKLTALIGPPEAGKTWIALAVGAELTRRGGQLVYLTAEDGLGDTIRPRFDSLGGDPKGFFVLCGTVEFVDGTEKRSGITLANISILEDAVTRTGAELVVVDPLQAYLGADVDMHRANEVRPILAALAALAERTGCAVLLITHLTKGSRDLPLYRALGSVDIVAAARSVLLAGCDPENEENRALVHIKCSVCRRGEPLGYKLDSLGFAWIGTSQLTAARLLAANANAETHSALAEAVEFLQVILAEGKRPARVVVKEAEGIGISERTLRRARQALGVRPSRIGFGSEGEWHWELRLDTQAIHRGPKMEGLSTYDEAVETKPVISTASPLMAKDAPLATYPENLSCGDAKDPKPWHCPQGCSPPHKSQTEHVQAVMGAGEQRGLWKWGPPSRGLV